MIATKSAFFTCKYPSTITRLEQPLVSMDSAGDERIMQSSWNINQVIGQI